MPDYQAPGVYLEEVTPAGLLKIADAPRTLAGFIGPGPVDPAGAGTAPDPIFRSFVAFTDRFGPTPAQPGPAQFFWRAVEGYFAEGGTALAVAWAADPGLPAFRAALAVLEAVGEVDLVAAPGSILVNDDANAAIAQALIDHAAKANRFAIIDPPPALDPMGIGPWRARFSSDHAALYYPWIRIAPAGTAPMLQPPSGHVAGIFARSQRERGVWKAPANELVRSAAGLAIAVNDRDQDPLNAASINCIRDFGARGIRVFGARTLGSDETYRYVSVRRLVSAIEHAIQGGLAAAIFEPDDPILWGHVRQAVENYLLGLWRAGALQGAKPEQAFFVRCDRTSMTQADIDEGRLVCEIGIAPVRPAEFLVLHFVQMTRDRPI